MKNVLNSEIYKARSRKSIKISTAICMILGIIMVTIMIIYGDKMNMNISGFNFIPGTTGANFNFLSIFAFIVPAMLITSEFKDNTMKNALFVGTSRVKLLISKFIVMFLVMMVLILALTIPSFIIFVCVKGWGVSFAFSQIGTIFASIFKLWLYLCAYCSIYALIGIVIRNLIASIALAYTFNIVESILLVLSTSIKKFEWIEKFLIAPKRSILSIDGMPSIDLMGIIVFLFGVILITGALSVIHFKNQEIKS